MNAIKDELPFFISLIRGIAAQFGEKCEVILHDFANPYDQTIIAIENGHVTNRKIGDCGTNLGLEVLRGTDKEGDKHNYFTQTKDGKILRSTSIYIKDQQGVPIGALCINWDITDFIMAEKAVHSITNSNLNKAVREVITNDVNEILDVLIQESIEFVGKPVSMMGKEDKIKGLRYLDEKGAFLIKKAGDRVIKFYDISKFTLYNYLEQSE